ncbi:hypothetical protein [Spirochaeta africana]|uniref:Lipid/polyisoprenoid-binding YceI-like domain-containing protein n=1 Tax=Spirochaeta africana (strain ATCC 700263 / DSM 8902 / Z-7692) TaxID=889378 RepID=H9UK12_SPIAZ|nr:hypothetical protein [Spirochaeta africana]AFG37855.1 hypothetical protein Spiaf_1798 [Spirochaeta africana DSM 8902]
MKKFFALLLVTIIMGAVGCENPTSSTSTISSNEGSTGEATDDGSDQAAPDDETTPTVGSYTATISGARTGTLSGPADFFYNSGNAPEGYNISLYGGSGFAGTGGTDGLADVQFTIGKTQPTTGSYPLQYRGGVQPDQNTAWQELSFYFVLDGVRYDIHDDASVSGSVEITSVDTTSIEGTAELSLEASFMQNFATQPIGTVDITIEFTTSYTTD